MIPTLTANIMHWSLNTAAEGAHYVRSARAAAESVFLSDQGILFVVRSVVVVSSDSISFFWYACEFQDS
jgi:hypothetical protein